jgi:uncharacterized protein (TIGR02246 family)
VSLLPASCAAVASVAAACRRRVTAAGIRITFVLMCGCVIGCSSERSPPRWSARQAPRPAASPAGRVPDVMRPPQPFRASAASPSVGPAQAAGTLVTVPTIPGVALPPPAEIAHDPAALPAAAPPPVASGPLRQRLDALIHQPPALAEIRGMMRDYLRAFNRHDPAALAAHWAGAGESVDLDSGEVTAGREAVRAVFSALFEQDDRATIDIDVHSIRPVRDDVAVVDGITLIAFADGPPAASRFSAVVVKEDGRWLLESVRETAQPADTVAATARPLDALEWLIGAWEDTGEGVLASSQCVWSAGRGFLIRSHAIRGDAVAGERPTADDARIPGLLSPGDPRPRELTEIIGWDPDRRVIRSWIFTSSGRFAEGTWTRDGDTWTVLVEGRGRDEGASCMCTLAPSGRDGLAMTCAGDALADLLPPACEFLRTAVLD